MGDSRPQDIKDLTGIMLRSRGVVTKLVESLVAADNPIALFKLTYDSHMGILAQKVMFNQLWTELDCMVEQRGLQCAAADFADITLESLEFGSIREVFLRAAPATTEQVEQLCWLQLYLQIALPAPEGVIQAAVELGTWKTTGG
jgi:hypothetical protein